MVEEVKTGTMTPQPQPAPNPRWNPEPLKEAMNIFKGVPKTPQIDQTPNRGTNWMGR